MRTTLTLDDDVLEAAREIAEARKQSLGAVISELARRALPTVTWSTKGGFPRVNMPAHSPVITSEAVARALDDE